MACCGKNRTEAAGLNQGSRSIGAARSQVASPTTYFRNSSSSGITVWGPVSGRMYRFPASGLAVAVDASDVASLSRVPHLKPVRPH
jgi:hypothetical protein